MYEFLANQTTLPKTGNDMIKFWRIYTNYTYILAFFEISQLLQSIVPML